MGAFWGHLSVTLSLKLWICELCQVQHFPPSWPPPVLPLRMCEVFCSIVDGHSSWFNEAQSKISNITISPPWILLRLCGRTNTLFTNTYVRRQAEDDGCGTCHKVFPRHVALIRHCTQYSVKCEDHLEHIEAHFPPQPGRQRVFHKIKAPAI